MFCCSENIQYYLLLLSCLLSFDVGAKNHASRLADVEVQFGPFMYYDDDDDDFPLWEGSSPGVIAPPEGKSAPAQVPPRDTALHPESLLLIFSRSK